MSSDKITIIADSTQLQAFGECQRLWQLGHSERLIATDKKDSSEASQMGTFGHRLLEVYYVAQAERDSPSRAFDKMLSHNIDQDHCECGCSEREHVESPAAFGVPFCIKCDCKEWHPKRFDLELDKRELVRQRLREYFFTYSGGRDIVPSASDKVEVGFSELLYEDCEHLFVLEGRIDLFGSIQGMPCVMDHKFQTRRHDLYKKSIQFRNYSMVARANMLVLNMIRLAKTVDKYTFERPVATFTTMEHAWWRGELITKFKQMATATRLGLFDKNWSSCSGKFGYKCDFTDLCEESNADIELIKRDTLYRIKPEWRPW